jgi:cell fate regulator YaaT (PSP1 superfamily)
MQQNTEFFPTNGQNTFDDEERKNRFLNSSNGSHHSSRSTRAASQPPHPSDQSFLSNPIPSSLGRTSGFSTSPWTPSNSRPVMGRSNLSIPGRSSSFSSSAAQGTFSSAMRERAFDSTFEDDESEAFSDAFDERQQFTPSYNDHRGRPYGQDPSRSRSQSLATTHSRPGPIGGGYVSSGSPGGLWKDPLSGPLSIPGSRFNSAGDIRPPGSSRYGSLGAIGRSPGGMFNASSPTSTLGNGYSNRQTIDPSNMSPFVRDVGSILLDEGSAFRELWAGMNIPKDENGGGGSGTTSRRHSVSVVQPRRGANVIGFNAPDSDLTDDGPGYSQPSHGRSGLLLSDDDLASDLGMLNLGSRDGPSSHGVTSQPSSLPIYAPLSHLSIPGGIPSSLSRRSPSDSGVSASGSSPPGRYDQQQQGPDPNIQQQAARFIPGQGIYLPGAHGHGTILPSVDRTRGPAHNNVTSPISPSAHHRGIQFPTQQAQPLSRRLSEAGQPPQTPLSELGKGVPLHSVPSSLPLYIVEFKAGRTDLFYLTDLSQEIRVGDLVIVEADRGKDLGKVVNDTITLPEVEAFQRQQVAKSQQQATGPDGAPMSPGGGNGGSTSKREINPKQIYYKASNADTAMLLTKIQDEMKALQLCQTKVRAKKLPMEVVDAEYQWDRRKLTFYFTAEKRIDFRELVRELFRLYKTRIWMASLQTGGGINYEQ